MSQADYTIEDKGAAPVRAELNVIFEAIATNNSGATEPTVKFPNQFWYDTSTNIVKIRNAANDAWISFVAFDQVNDKWYFLKLGVGSGVIPVGGVGMALEGTHGADSSTVGPHKQFTTASDDHPIYQLMNWAHDNISQGYDCYFDGSNWKSSDLGSNFRIAKLADEFQILVDENITPGNNTTLQKAFVMNKNGQRTLPLQSIFEATGGAQNGVTGNGDNYLVQNDTEVEDRGGHYDHTTGLYTTPIAATYSFVSTIVSVVATTPKTIFENLWEVSSGNKDGFRCDSDNVADPSSGIITCTIALQAYLEAAVTVGVRLDVVGGSKDVNILTSKIAGHLVG